MDSALHAVTIGSNGLATATPLASGELLISGYLTRWSELDREGDRMVRGSFAKAIPAFLKSHAPLCYGHKLREVLGRVIDLSEDAVGVKMVAKVNRQPESSPLRWVYDAIRNRTIRGLSAGAIFKRLRRFDGTADIMGVDLVECSVTGTPMLPSTSFEIVSAGKAMELWGTEDRVARLRRDVAALREARHALEVLSMRLSLAAASAPRT
jgi:HK97 family phage prohead protease